MNIACPNAEICVYPSLLYVVQLLLHVQHFLPGRIGELFYHSKINIENYDYFQF